ncbi:RebB family R body protein [Frigidibacter sp. RF13]|uniref:RebB family R body protein n=1 Tax=Frigidibacter sp. RF13 TaxID=2997340 RepID=UPI00226DFFFE|nr:RebB family R body protein [Frigidibacter sp. RF13]MCY1128651.1 RebB family R body protein [Frigidibacter sp. RF13]
MNQTPVNSQITDAVTQSNVNVVASAPAQSLGMLYQMATHAAGLSMQNAVQSQQNLNQIGNAVVATAVREILAIPTTPGGGGGGGSGGGSGVTPHTPKS